MKKFEVPQISVMKLTSENVFTDSQCLVEALGCASCYCVAVVCEDTYNATCTGCYDFWGDDD